MIAVGSQVEILPGAPTDAVGETGEVAAIFDGIAVVGGLPERFHALGAEPGEQYVPVERLKEVPS